MGERANPTDLELAALISSKICHDVIGPVGAIYNGLEILDEDEFAEHQLRYGYPAEVIAQARATTDDLVARITARTEPFAEVGAAWLARFQAGVSE